MWPFDRRGNVFDDAERQWERGNRYRSALIESTRYADAPEVSFCLVCLPGEQQAQEIIRMNLDALRIDQSKTEWIVLMPHDMHHEWTDMSKSEPQVKVYTYDGRMDERKLRNQAFRVGRGKLLVSLAWGDLLPSRATRFIADEMAISRFEQVIALEKNWRRVYRMAIWRDTFYELGGFNDSLPFYSQCDDLIDRARKYGVVYDRKTHENYVQTRGPKRAIAWPWGTSKRLKLSMDMSGDQIKPIP